MAEGIRFEAVDFGYWQQGEDGRRRRQVLQQFSLSLPAQGLSVISGPSGCGKSTLLHLLCGLLQPQAGRVLGVAGRKLAVVFQEDRLLPWCTARENLSLVAPAEEAARRLAQVGLAEVADALPAQLSGGMRRRLAIARALAYRGDLLLLDEPFTGIDEPRTQELLAQLLAEYRDRPVVMITHQREQVLGWAQRIVYLSGPPLRILAQGRPHTAGPLF